MTTATTIVRVNEMTWHGLPVIVAEFSFRGNRWWRHGKTEAEAITAILPVFKSVTGRSTVVVETNGSGDGETTTVERTI